jgi:hypothetical protein
MIATLAAIAASGSVALLMRVYLDRQDEVSLGLCFGNCYSFTKFTSSMDGLSTEAHFYHGQRNEDLIPEESRGLRVATIIAHQGGNFFFWLQCPHVDSGHEKAGASTFSYFRFRIGHLYVFMFLAAISIAFFIRRRVRKRQELLQNRRCTKCGYDLRASTSRCPECGRPLDVDAPVCGAGN